ncbi:glycosyltransferase family 2 protein [Streptomyces sp. NPDC002758]
MSIKVSVVIPVYNPGKYIQPCIDSLLRQTLPADEFEVLFVDDGSTDETPAKLDGLAGEHPHFRVIHIPNSGWPGKPRNIGVGEAKGDYIQFVDQDDYLASDALRRMYEMGHRNGSDIVIGKVASNFRGVPHGVFRTDREKCDLQDAPLYDSLTPHKMFRAEFLRENKIVYPEGKRRLEDQLYMMEAYFPAKVVSILGSYTCYYYSRRGDGNNAGSVQIVPSGYYGNLREVLDVVVANTEPGAFRDLLLRRFYRVEMLGRLSEPNVLKYDDAYLDEMVDAVQPLTEEFMTDGVHDGLGALSRVRSTLLRRDDRQGLVRFARHMSSIKGTARLEDVAWQPDGKLAVTVTARLVHGENGEPLRLLRREDRVFLHPDVTQGFLEDGELVDVTDELGDFKAEMSLRNRETAVEWPCSAKYTSTVEDLGNGSCEVVLRGTGLVSPQGIKGRGPVSRGFWDIWVPVRGLGVVRKARLGADRAAHVDEDCRPALLGSPARPVIPYFTDPHGNLTLDVAQRSKKLVPYLESRTVLRMPGGRPELRLDLFTRPATAPLKADLVLTSESGRSYVLPGEVRHVAGRGHIALPERAAGVPAGRWNLSAALDGDKSRSLELCEVTVRGNGRLQISSDLAVVDLEIVRAALAKRRKAAVRRRLRAVGGPFVRRLPSPARKKLRGLARKLVG